MSEVERFQTVHLVLFILSSALLAGVGWYEASHSTPTTLTPIVGLIPTMPLVDDGPTIEPSVSEPMVAVEKFADVATPGPELDPLGTRSSAYGFRQTPPRPASHPDRPPPGGPIRPPPG